MKSQLFVLLIVSLGFCFADGEIPPYPHPLPGEVFTPPSMVEYVPDGLNLNAPAPEFSLASIEPGKNFKLNDFLGRPLILVTGSYSCPVFRGQIQAIEKIYQKYQNQFAFLMIYLREAHPNSKLYIQSNKEKVLKFFTQTQSETERILLAKESQETYGLSFPISVDDDSGTFHKLYASWPVRFFIVDQKGVLKFKGRMGPHGFWPHELEAGIQSFLTH